MKYPKGFEYLRDLPPEEAAKHIKLANAVYQARTSFAPYVQFTMPSYEMHWFHKVVCEELEMVEAGVTKRLAIFMPAQKGKAIVIQCWVLTPNGWVMHGELKVGDYVYNDKLEPVKVLSVTKHYEHEVLDLTFSTGETMQVSPQHDWAVLNDDGTKEVIDTAIVAQRLRKGEHVKLIPSNGKQIEIIRVEDAGRKMVNCIEVEGGIYLAGNTSIPTHNSELSSRRFPSWLLGRNPDKRLGIVSYNSQWANSFSTDIQNIMDTHRYKVLFPNTPLGASKIYGTPHGSTFKRTLAITKIYKRKGFFATGGMDSGITGISLDGLIIDDPFKGWQEASSPTVRQRVQKTFTSVLEKRLHEDSFIILLFTRWHSDDLWSYIINRDGLVEDGGDWRVVTFRNIKEARDKHPADVRQIGEALWAQRESVATILKDKKQDPQVYAAMHQQDPDIVEGNMIDVSAFRKYNGKEHLKNIAPKDSYGIPIIIPHFCMDTALTSRAKLLNMANPEKDAKKKSQSAILVWCVIGNDFYVLEYLKGWWRFDETIQTILSTWEKWAVLGASTFWVENKTRGTDVIETLQSHTNISIAPDNLPAGQSKEERVFLQMGHINGGRVYVPAFAAWLGEWLKELKKFPMGSGEAADTLSAALRKAFPNSGVGSYRSMLG